MRDEILGALRGPAVPARAPPAAHPSRLGAARVPGPRAAPAQSAQLDTRGDVATWIGRAPSAGLDGRAAGHLALGPQHQPDHSLLLLHMPLGMGPDEQQAGGQLTHPQVAAAAARVTAGSIDGTQDAYKGGNEQGHVVDAVTHARRALFEAESWQAVCSSFRATVTSLMTAGLQTGSEQMGSHGPHHAQTDHKPAGPQAAAPTQGEVHAFEPASRPDGTALGPQGPGAEAAAGTGSMCKELLQQDLLVACELFAQWVLGQEVCAEDISKVLALLDQLAVKNPSAAEALQRVAAVLQNHAKAMYGAKLAFVRLL